MRAVLGLLLALIANPAAAQPAVRHDGRFQVIPVEVPCQGCPFSNIFVFRAEGRSLPDAARITIDPATPAAVRDVIEQALHDRQGVVVRGTLRIEGGAATVLAREASRGR